MQIFGIRTPVIRPGDHLVDVILDSLQKQNEAIEEKDMLAIASKVVATTQGRLIRLSSVNPSERARELAEKYRMDSSFVEVVVVEADKIFGGASGALLTLKDGLLVPNAGVDGKNAPQGSVALWPEDAQGSAEQIRRGILEKTGKKVGVLIVDSQVTPLRMGTKGIALGIAGFNPVKDCRTEKDLYGKRLLITRHALADDLASAAHLLMGETDGQVPAVLAREVPISLTEEADSSQMLISENDCLFMNSFL